MPLETEVYDVIVVGAGAAGCVIASRLSETPTLRVLLLEAGPDHTNDPKVTSPMRSRQMFGDPSYDWDYHTIPQKHADNRAFIQTRGRMLGGSSAINSHSLVFPSRAMHDAWVEIAGNNIWSWDEMQPFYEKFQTVQAPNQSDTQAAPSTNGPIKASYTQRRTELEATWKEAFEALGSFYPGYAADGQAIGGTITTNAIDGRRGKCERSHAGKEYLKVVRGRENITIFPNTTVKKIIFDYVSGSDTKPRATGVLVDKDGKPTALQAKREIVLCAGAFGSPQILELSGIGNKDILEQAGVECIVNLPAVGENLQDHINFGPSVEIKSHIETFDVLSQSQSTAESAQAEYDNHRTGILSEGPAYHYAYWPLQLLETPEEGAEMEKLVDELGHRANPLEQARFDFNKKMLRSPVEASATMAMIPTLRYKEPEAPVSGRYLTFLSMLSHPFSTGSSHITCSDETSHPRIDMNFLSHPLDMEILVKHTLQTQRFLARPQFAQILEAGGKWFPGNMAPEELSSDGIKAIIRKYSATNYHPCGTCVMARPDLGGVVDANLAVHGADGLRICDASIFPIIPRGNILTTVYAVAERGADLIREEMVGAFARD